MTDIINNIVLDKQDIKNQLGDLPQSFPVLKTFNESIRPKQIATTIKKRTIGSSFIIGHVTQAQRDVTLLDVTFGEFETVYVIPNNDIFEEYFDQELYIDVPETTGTIDTVEEKFTFDSGETLQSQLVYKTDKNVTAVQFTSIETGIFFVEHFKLGISKLGVDAFGGGNIGTKVSNDGGVTWVEMQNPFNKIVFDIPSTGGVMFKFLASEPFVFNVPLKLQIFTE